MVLSLQCLFFMKIVLLALQTQKNNFLTLISYKNLISRPYPHCFFFPSGLFAPFFSDLGRFRPSSERVAHFYAHFICLDLSKICLDSRHVKGLTREFYKELPHTYQKHTNRGILQFLTYGRNSSNPHETHTFMGSVHLTSVA